MTVYPLTDEAAHSPRRAAAQYRATTWEDRCRRWELAASDYRVARVAVEKRLRKEEAV